MRVVVTGAAGFLASHVADHLSKVGHEISVFDLAPSKAHPTQVGSLLDLEALRRAFVDAEAICHLAAVGDVYLAADNPSLAASVNVVGTANVCEVAREKRIGRVVVASTWEVYGEPEYQPIDERHPCRPDHPYSITKLAGERIALAYAHFKNVDTVALRLGTAFGTRMRANSVFSIFVRKALAGEPITIQGSGQQGRQFTHASDVARGFELALTAGKVGTAYNLVSDRMVTIRELAEMICKSAPTQLTYGAARPGDVPSATVSSKLAEKELGWRPMVQFEDGLNEIIEESRASRMPPGG